MGLLPMTNPELRVPRAGGGISPEALATSGLVPAEGDFRALLLAVAGLLQDGATPAGPGAAPAQGLAGQAQVPSGLLPGLSPAGEAPEAPPEGTRDGDGTEEEGPNPMKQPEPYVAASSVAQLLLAVSGAKPIANEAHAGQDPDRGLGRGPLNGAAAPVAGPAAGAEARNEAAVVSPEAGARDGGAEPHSEQQTPPVRGGAEPPLVSSTADSSEAPERVGRDRASARAEGSSLPEPEPAPLDPGRMETAGRAGTNRPEVLGSDEPAPAPESRPAEGGGGAPAHDGAVRLVGSATGTAGERGVRRGPEVADTVRALDPRDRGAAGDPRGLGPIFEPVHAPELGPIAHPAPAAEPQEGEGPVRPRFVDQVVEAVVELEGDREARVHLDPPELGEVLLKLRVDSGAVRVDIRAERFDVLQLFVAHRPLLEQQLGARGFALGGLSLALASDPGNGRDSQGGSAWEREREGAAVFPDREPSIGGSPWRVRRRFNPHGNLSFYA